MQKRRGILRPATLNPNTPKERLSFLLWTPERRCFEVVTQTGTPFSARDMIFFANREVEVEGNEGLNEFQLIKINRLDTDAPDFPPGPEGESSAPALHAADRG